MPELKTIIVESNDPIGPYNAKGLDSPCMAISQAIGNAIYDAIGVRIMELPITPEKILKALEEKEQFAAEEG
jgi:CO/xanthine dehydrogenase Mo-binding subunit